MTKDFILQNFAAEYGDGGKIRFFRSPGRVNLIGEHTDYNGGAVFPCALSLGTFGAARLRNDGIVRLFSADFIKKGEIDLAADIVYDEENGWLNYPMGVIKTLLDNGYTNMRGLDICVAGNLPNGAGLSSSASLELLILTMFNKIFNLNIDPVKAAVMCQSAENNFVGVNCGIMDQFVVSVGKEGAAVLLNCTTLEYSLVPLKLDGYKIVISNTNKRRGLADSKYNERRAECEAALAILAEYTGAKCLCDINKEDFVKLKSKIADETIRNRAEHVIYENFRVSEAMKSLKENNIVLFGKLITDAHESLRDLYGVSCKELDVIVEEALKIDGCVGSRMTGAGFGGCSVNIVRTDAVEQFIQDVGKNYKEQIGYSADFYIAETGDGSAEYM